MLNDESYRGFRYLDIIPVHRRLHGDAAEWLAYAFTEQCEFAHARDGFPGAIHFLSSTNMASRSSSASSVCVTGARNSVSPVFNSETLVLPSGNVNLIRPPFST